MAFDRIIESNRIDSTIGTLKASVCQRLMCVAMNDKVKSSLVSVDSSSVLDAIEC